MNTDNIIDLPREPMGRLCQLPDT